MMEYRLATFPGNQVFREAAQGSEGWAAFAISRLGIELHFAHNLARLPMAIPSL